jgi:hypothetical protein
MSDYLKLNSRDFLKGIIMAILGAVFTTLYQVISQGGFSALNIQQILLVAVLAALSYITKNLFSDDSGKFLGRV